MCEMYRRPQPSWIRGLNALRSVSRRSAQEGHYQAKMAAVTAVRSLETGAKAKMGVSDTLKGPRTPKITTPPKKKLKTTLLSGFLGAGKTTLLKHILENKSNLKCAIIVNDMAEINIDASLIKNTSFVQAEEKVVEMQNGCICCTLRQDLLEEVGRLARDEKFDYLVIESTGISEPQQVAETFAMDLNDLQQVQEEEIENETDGHKSKEIITKEIVEGEFDDINDDEKIKEDEPKLPLTSLKGLAELDCCVTVIDASNMLAQLNSIKRVQDMPDNEKQEGDERTISHLLIDQMEFANVILLNKADLICEEHLNQLKAFLHTINPNAEVITTTEARVDLKKIINTGIFDMDEAAKSAGWLQSLMADTPHTPETLEYGISSFIYKARRPFHPEKLYGFLNQYFIVDEPEVEEHDHDHDHHHTHNSENKVDEDQNMHSEEEEVKARNEVLTELGIQKEGENIQKPTLNPEEISRKREALHERFGQLYRAKGHIWLPGARNDMSGDLGLAGSVCRIVPDTPWFAALPPEMWPPGLEDLEAFKSDMGDTKDDRRQELVFIGQNLKKDALVKALDDCLLKSEEKDFKDPFKAWPQFELDIQYVTDDEEEEEDEEDDKKDSDIEEENDDAQSGKRNRKG